jgi:hypothetical protein
VACQPATVSQPKKSKLLSRHRKELHTCDVAKHFFISLGCQHGYPMVLPGRCRGPISVSGIDRGRQGYAYIDTNSDKTAKTDVVPNQAMR